MTELTSNVNISGDEARLLLALLAEMPIIQLYLKLTTLHLVQPK
jgi:hypothetical protein